MTRLGIFLRRVVLPVAIAALLALAFHSLYARDGKIDYLLMWVCIGFPFGIRRMLLWLVPRNYDLGGTVGIFALDVIVGGIIGGFALIGQVISGIVATIRG